jgi:CHAT domain-containing protein/tetratricopeptide (TPR) repeat protein
MSLQDLPQSVLWFQSLARHSSWLGLLVAFSFLSPGQPVLLRSAFASSSPARPVSTPVLDASHTQSAVAQDQTTLIAGVPVTREIKGGESQSFKLWIPPGQYLRLLIRQHGIILAAALFDSHGKQVVEMDNPAGGHGPIYISTIAEGSGEYRLEVRSTESWANAGRFEAVIDEQRGATPEDKDHIAAQLAFAEAQRLAAQETKESRQAALKKYDEALTYWQRVENTHWRVLTLYAIGSTYRRLGEMGHAYEWFVKSLDQELISKLEQDDWRLIASALNNGGLTAADLGNDTSAFVSLNQALKLYQDHGDKPGEASALNNLGYVYYNLGRFHEAAESFEKSLPLRRAENNRLREFNVINNLGAIYDKLGEPQRALESCRKTLEVWRDLYRHGQLSDPDRLAAALNNTAAAYDRLGEWQEALNSYEEALSILRKSGNVQRQASTLDNIAELYHVLGDSNRALEYYNEALALIREKVKDPKAEANVLTHIGQVYVSQEKLAQALEYFKASREIPQSPQRKAELLTNMGMVYSIENNPAAALKLYAEALILFRLNDDLRGQAAALHKLSEAYRQIGNDSLALENLNQALSLWRTVKDRRGEALTLQGIAQVKGSQNNLKEALRLSEDATAIIESLRTKVSSHQLRTSYFAAQENYYEFNIDLNMGLYRQDQSPERLAAALQTSERARSRSLIDTLIEARSDITEGASSELLRLEHEVRRKLRAKLEAQTAFLSSKHDENEAKAISNEVSDLIRQQDELRGRIGASSPKHAQLIQPQTSDAKEIQQQLDDKTLLLEYALGGKRSYVWVVSSDSIRGVELAARDQIESVARRVTEALTARNREVKGESFAKKNLRVDGADRDLSEASAALSKMVLEPVASLLGQKRLVIVADGALQVVPFGALPVPANSPTAVNSKMMANPITAVNSKTMVDPAAAANLSPANSSFLSLFQQTMTRSLPLSVLIPSQTNSSNIAGSAAMLLTAGAAPMPLIAGAASIPLMSEHEIVYLPSASVLALQRRELANRKPAPYAVAVVADPVFDIGDARVARAIGNGSQRRKDVVTNSRKDAPKTGQSTMALPEQVQQKVLPTQNKPTELPKQSEQSNLARQAGQNALAKPSGQSLLPKQGGQSSTSPSAKDQSLLANALRDVGLDPDRPMPRLAFSLREAKAILRAAGANQSFSALDFKASRATATSPELSKYQIIHFATHGVLDLEHPELSGIVLSMVDEKGQPQDGYLRLHEIYNLNLPAELVVLSACQTGVGKQIKGEGLIALTRGFMYAGAKSIVASLWKVDDAATSALMAEFYKQMFVNKLKPAAALRAAQVKTSQEKRWESPYYWAGFFLQGDWN